MRIRGFIILVASIWLVVYGLAWVFTPVERAALTPRSKLFVQTRTVWTGVRVGPFVLPRREVVYDLDYSKLALPHEPTTLPYQ